ncbi:predicted protein [Naegleria gruberi]|uniref:Predicted protein n=1 Tax=Naegleria gruberi TaxID=5762 RepID=D2VL16_NAEGR|nr:uncharacterized protein NAEGRDRAFT_69628 [Naegleria gruberi]EFC42544.1 predicted protein [Naegleria gruberi]|eukprot:XP_002675288.1 predicted protein [Naegleria gruberi strain NEG-M]
MRSIVLIAFIAALCAVVCIEGFAIKPTITIKKISDDTKSPINDALCPTCVDLLDFGLADLMAALDAGTVYSCLSLCNYVSPLGPYAVEGCDVICTAIGVNAFIDVIKKADLDPIYGCQLAKICPIHDCTAKVCALVDTVGVVPSSGPAGGKYSFYSRLNVLNESGPGEVTLEVTGTSIAKNQVVYRYYQASGFKPGVYGIKFQIDTSGDDGQDWFPGAYHAKVNVCEGECGSWIKRPHTRLLASGVANFTITG